MCDNLPKLEDFKPNGISDKYLKRNYPEFYDYLNKRYPDIDKISEKMHLYYNELDSPPVCKICGGKVRYNCTSGL